MRKDFLYNFHKRPDLAPLQKDHRGKNAFLLFGLFLRILRADDHIFLAAQQRKRKPFLHHCVADQVPSQRT